MVAASFQQGQGAFDSGFIDMAFEVDEEDVLRLGGFGGEGFDPGQVQLGDLEGVESVDQRTGIVRDLEHDRGLVVARAMGFLVADDREASFVIRGIFNIGEQNAEIVTDCGLSAGDSGGAAILSVR